MRIAECIAFLVADRFEELVDPDGGIDRETFAVECGERSRSGAGLEDGPEAVDTHFEVSAGCSRVVEIYDVARELVESPYPAKFNLSKQNLNMN